MKIRAGETWWISPKPGERGETDHVTFLEDPYLDMDEETGELSVMARVRHEDGSTMDKGDEMTMSFYMLDQATKDEPDQEE